MTQLTAEQVAARPPFVAKAQEELDSIYESLRRSEHARIAAERDLAILARSLVIGVRTEQAMRVLRERGHL